MTSRVSRLCIAMPHDIWVFIIFRILGGLGIGIASIYPWGRAFAGPLNEQNFFD